MNHTNVNNAGNNMRVKGIMERGVGRNVALVGENGADKIWGEWF